MGAKLATAALAADEFTFPVDAIIAAVTLFAPRLGPPVLAKGLATAALDAFAANSVVLANRPASAFFTDRLYSVMYTPSVDFPDSLGLGDQPRGIDRHCWSLRRTICICRRFPDT